MVALVWFGSPGSFWKNQLEGVASFVPLQFPIWSSDENKMVIGHQKEGFTFKGWGLANEDLTDDQIWESEENDQM